MKHLLSKMVLVALLICSSYSISNGCSSQRVVGSVFPNCSIMAFLELYGGGGFCSTNSGMSLIRTGIFGCSTVSQITEQPSSISVVEFRSYGRIETVYAYGNVKATIHVGTYGINLTANTYEAFMDVTGDGMCCGSW